jgi:pimeloyl-ACP methyl ester carboxylesterase
VPITDSKLGPGGFWEPIKMLPLLAEPTDTSQPAFHVVVPSLPNFGFSEGVKRPDFGLRQYAETIHKLMLRLNYDKYSKYSHPYP